MDDSQRVIYLHGFASSPQSSKARFFAEKLAAEGFSVQIPDLAEGDFEHLTITRQLAVIEALQAGQPAVLIGSSLGGYLAALHAARHPEISKIILLAPAFGFHDLWVSSLGQEKWRAWRENGSIPVFHYGAGRERPLAFDLMEDASRYPAFPRYPARSLLFHGVNDPVVPIAQSRRYAGEHPNVQLIELSSGHELTDVLDDIWQRTKAFLKPGPGNE